VGRAERCPIANSFAARAAKLQNYFFAFLHSVPRRGVLPVEEGSTSIVAGLVE
jgi:hypothetical protein